MDAVAVITLNRPHVHNAINPEVQVRLNEAWHRVREDASIRVAVITGTGDRAFCSGGDLQELIPLLTRARPPHDAWDRKLLEGPPAHGVDAGKPVIAAVNGFAVAGGMELLLSCDLRVAADTPGSACKRSSGPCSPPVHPRCACHARSLRPSLWSCFSPVT